jgi:large subunit ribosomal protein L29
MAKTAELRDMSDEQVHLTWKEASEHLFRLRMQAQTEKLDAPTELKRHRRLIARCQTVLNERARGAKQKSAGTKS